MSTVGATHQPHQLATFAQFPHLRHGFTGRDRALWRDGDVSYRTGGDPERVLANRHHWATMIGVEPERLVAIHIVHSNHVVAIDGDSWSFSTAPRTFDEVPRADALITTTPNTPLFLTFADCTPLLFFDPLHNVIGLAHAGWRGTVTDIAGETVRAMQTQYGSDPTTIIAGIGPAIGRCCYIVDEPVVAGWQALGLPDTAVLEEIAPVAGRRQWRFDLALANRQLLERAGVPATQIEDAAICTSCQVAHYPSHRAEAGQAGRFAAIIGLCSSTSEA